MAEAKLRNFKIEYLNPSGHGINPQYFLVTNQNVIIRFWLKSMQSEIGGEFAVTLYNKTTGQKLDTVKRKINAGIDETYNAISWTKLGYGTYYFHIQDTSSSQSEGYGTVS